MYCVQMMLIVSSQIPPKNANIIMLAHECTLFSKKQAYMYIQWLIIQGDVIILLTILY